MALFYCDGFHQYKANWYKTNWITIPGTNLNWTTAAANDLSIAWSRYAAAKKSDDDGLVMQQAILIVPSRPSIVRAESLMPVWKGAKRSRNNPQVAEIVAARIAAEMTQNLPECLRRSLARRIVDAPKRL